MASCVYLTSPRVFAVATSLHCPWVSVLPLLHEVVAPNGRCPQRLLLSTVGQRLRWRVLPRLVRTLALEFPPLTPRSQPRGMIRHLRLRPGGMPRAQLLEPSRIWKHISRIHRLLHLVVVPLAPRSGPRFGRGLAGARPGVMRVLYGRLRLPPLHPRAPIVFDSLRHRLNPRLPQWFLCYLEPIVVRVRVFRRRQAWRCAP